MKSILYYFLINPNDNNSIVSTQWNAFWNEFDSSYASTANMGKVTSGQKYDLHTVLLNCNALVEQTCVLYP